MRRLKYVRSLHLLIDKLNSTAYGNKRNEMRIKILVSVKLGKSRPGVYFSSISQTQKRDNKILSRRRSVFFFQSILQKPCFVKSFCFVITIYCFVAKYTYYTCWNGESLISAQPRISAHQLSRSKNVMSAQGGYSNKYGNTRSFGPCFKNHYSAQGHKTLDQTTLDTAILNSVKIRFNIWNPLYKKYALIVPLFLLPNSD